MEGTLGSGSEDQTGSKKENGNGLMEVSGASPSGLINQISSHLVRALIMTVSRYTIMGGPKMDGMTKAVLINFGLSAAGEFAQVQTKRQINLH